MAARGEPVERTHCIADLGPILDNLHLEESTSPTDSGTNSDLDDDGEADDLLQIHALMEVSNVEFGHQLVVNPSDMYLGEEINIARASQIFRAQLLTKQQAVTVKRMAPSIASHPVRERWLFCREVALLSNMSHPNIMKILGVSTGVDPLNVSIVLENCAGGTCYDLLHVHRQLNIALPQKGKMLSDIAVAMDYLHGYEPQIVLGDLSSRSAYLATPFLALQDVAAQGLPSASLAPAVMISDFGLDRMRNWNSGAQRSSLGEKARWTAPEVVTCGILNEYVDVYSYGMLMYEFLFRTVPFANREIYQVQDLVLAGSRPQIPEGAPVDAKTMMMQCWSADPCERPPFIFIVEELYQLDPFEYVASLEVSGQWGDCNPSL